MMRTPIIAANWKMNKTASESVSFVEELLPHILPFSGVERVICPTFMALVGVADVLRDTPIAVGAQQMHWEAKGAFTSQIAPTMLQGYADYVIIGHSECRQYLNETDETVNKKALAALHYGLKPIIAIGESLAQNQAGETESFVSGQVRAALQGISAEQMPLVVLAYEPIWAIGTGLNATSEFANRICGQVVRGVVREMFGDTIADQVRVQYGGSVTPENMLEYMSLPDIDGALVGGASLDVSKFTTLVRLAAEAKGA